VLIHPLEDFAVKIGQRPIPAPRGSPTEPILEGDSSSKPFTSNTRRFTSALYQNRKLRGGGDVPVLDFLDLDGYGSMHFKHIGR